MEIRYAIVDDEAPGRINLRLALDSHPAWRLAAECDSAQRARAAIAAGGIDVVFLDIQMPRESGLVLARELAAMDEPPLVIFVTAHNTHAVEAFEVHALDYLLKPLDDARLAHAAERAACMLALRQRKPYGAALRAYAGEAASPYLERISVRSVGRIDQVEVADLLWVEAEGNYVALHTAARTLLHRVPLGQLERRLPPAQFLRVHRGAIVARAQVAGLTARGDGSWQLRLRCGAQVPVSERYAPSLKQFLER